MGPTANDILADIKAAMVKLDAIPPAPIMASSNLFPDTKAMRFKMGDREVLAAGPGFWRKIPEVPASQAMNPLFRHEIVDLDISANSEMRAKVFLALAAAAGFPA